MAEASPQQLVLPALQYLVRWHSIAAAAAAFAQLPVSLLLPSITAAREGFPLSHACRHYLEYSGKPIYGRDPVSRLALHPHDDTLMAAGDLVQLPGLADSLQAIADEGPELFYQGELAARIVEHVRQGGGVMTREDFSRYEALRRGCLQISVGDWQVALNPPPAIGGSMLGALLLGMQPDKSLVDALRAACICRVIWIFPGISPSIVKRLAGQCSYACGMGSLGNQVDGFNRVTLGRRQQRTSLRDHRFGRLWQRRNACQHRPLAKQLPGRAGAQSTRPGRITRRRETAVQHGANHCAQQDTTARHWLARSGSYYQRDGTNDAAFYAARRIPAERDLVTSLPCRSITRTQRRRVSLQGSALH